MTRIERAHRIRDHVLAVAGESQIYSHVNSGRALLAYGPGWFARIHTIFNPAFGAPYWPRWGPPPRRGDRMRGKWLPNRMGLWLYDGPKVLTVEWLDEFFRLVSMRRGDWESEYFGLEPYRGTGGLKPWEMYERRSKRW